MHSDKRHRRRKKVSWQIVNLFSERRKFLRTMNFMQKQRKKEKVYLTWKLHNSASKQLNIHSSVHRKERKMSLRDWMLQKRKKRYDMFGGWSISNIETTNASSRLALQHLECAAGRVRQWLLNFREKFLLFLKLEAFLKKKSVQMPLTHFNHVFWLIWLFCKCMQLPFGALTVS